MDHRIYPDPLGLVLYYAFTGADGGFTLANVLAITEPVHLKSLWTSLKMAFLTTLICFILAYPLGLVLCSLNLKKSNFIIFLFILPIVDELSASNHGMAADSL